MAVGAAATPATDAGPAAMAADSLPTLAPAQYRMPRQHGHGHPSRRGVLSQLGLVLALALMVTASAFIVVVPNTGGRARLFHPPPQQQRAAASLLPRRVFNNWFGSGGDKKKGQGQGQQQQQESPFKPELQGQYNDGIGAKIWIYLFSGKIAKVRVGSGGGVYVKRDGVQDCSVL